MCEAQYCGIDTTIGVLLLIITGILIERTASAEKAERRRYGFFDFLKGAAILAVIAIHVDKVIPVLGNASDTLWMMALPSFVLASGYLVAKRYAQGIEKDYFTKIIWRIGGVYVIFTLLSKLIEHSAWTPKDLFLDLLLGRGAGGGFYFIPIILQLYLLFPVMKILKSRLGITAFIVLAFLISVYFGCLDYDLETPAWNSNPFSLAFCGRFIFFFAFGMCASRLGMPGRANSHLAVGWALSTLALGACIEMVGTWLYLIPVYFLSIAAVFFMFYTYQAIRQVTSLGWVGVFGQNSIVIYMAHGAIYTMVAPGAIEFLGNNLLTYALVVGLTAIGSLAISIVFMMVYNRALSLGGAKNGRDGARGAGL